MQQRHSSFQESFKAKSQAIAFFNGILVKLRFCKSGFVARHKSILLTEQRKLEMERRTERKIQKERENEGDEFKDKESFITPAYQAKLEERKQQEAEERIKEQMEGRAFFSLFQN